MDKATRLATVLFEHANVGDGHAPVYGLAHVVDGQKRYLHGGQRLHFHTCRANGFNSCAAGYGGAVLVGREINCRARQCQRVAQGNQVTGFFRRHDARHAGYAQYIAFFGIACQNNGQRCRIHDNTPLGNGHTVRRRFGSDINHVGLALGIEMSERMAR